MQYCYTIRAVDSANNVSADSTQTCATTQAVVTGDTTNPSVPGYISVTAASSTQLDISWGASTDNVAVAGYRIYKDGVLLASVTSGTSTTDTGLTPSTQYCYTVSAYDAANNESPQTSQGCATTSLDTLSAGLVAYFPFLGNANDASGNGNNGTVNGATWTADRFGNTNAACSFNGTTNYISAPDNSLPLSNVARSIMAWVHPSVISSDYYIAGWGAALTGQMSYINLFQGKFRFIGLNGPDVNGPANVTANQWYFIAATYDGSTLRLYVNGSLATSKSITLSTTSGSINIGQFPGGGGYFNGVIDDIRIYNRALSANEIQSLYNATQ